MQPMSRRLLFAEDLDVHEYMGVRILNKLFRNVRAQHWVLASSPPALYSATLPGHFNYADAANAAVQFFPQ